MLTVKHIMTSNPLTLSRYNSVKDARKLMHDRDFRHIPIVDEKLSLIGLVTQGAVLSHGISSQDIADPDELAEIEQGTLLADIMNDSVTTVSPETPLIDAANLILTTKFGCLPVIDENKKLKGIVTDYDFVTLSVELLSKTSTRPGFDAPD